MTDAHSDVSKHVRLYMGVLAALALFTVLTVAAAHFDASVSVHVAIALLIATVKGSLVAAVFMHLKQEKAVALWGVLLLCAIFVIVLLAIPVLVVQDLPPGVSFGTWG